VSDVLPNARILLRNGCRLLVWCKACRHQQNADLAGMVADGRDDVPSSGSAAAGVGAGLPTAW
jgi:hypothetical protein